MTDQRQKAQSQADPCRLSFDTLECGTRAGEPLLLAADDAQQSVRLHLCGCCPLAKVAEVLYSSPGVVAGKSRALVEIGLAIEAANDPCNARHGDLAPGVRSFFQWPPTST